MPETVYAYLDQAGRRVLCANARQGKCGRFEIAVVDEFAIPGLSPMRRLRLHPHYEQVKGQNLWKVPNARTKTLVTNARLKALNLPQHSGHLPAGTVGTTPELPTSVICSHCGQLQVLDAERLRITPGEPAGKSG